MPANDPALHYVQRLRDEAHRYVIGAQRQRRAKAIELHGMPEFEDLYQQALKLDLTETERVAYALALDMEN